MPPIFIGVFAGIAYAVLLSSFVAWADNRFFPDLVNGNLGYFILEILRLLPLLGQALGITLSCLFLLSKKYNQLYKTLFVIGGILTVIISFWCYDDFRTSQSVNSSTIALRGAVFDWGIYAASSLLMMIVGMLGYLTYIFLQNRN